MEAPLDNTCHENEHDLMMTTTEDVREQSPRVINVAEQQTAIIKHPEAFDAGERHAIMVEQGAFRGRTNRPFARS